MPTYKCNACNYTSTIKSNMNKHKKTSKHIMNTKLYKNKGGLITSSNNKKRWATSDTINNHNCGNDKMKYCCKYCGKYFNDNSNLLKHQKKYCKENELIAIKKQIEKNSNDIAKKTETETENEKLKRKVKELENENKNLKLANSQMELSIETLKKENKKLTTKKDKYKKKITELTELVEEREKTESIRINNMFDKRLVKLECKISKIQEHIDYD